MVPDRVHHYQELLIGAGQEVQRGAARCNTRATSCAKRANGQCAQQAKVSARLLIPRELLTGGHRSRHNLDGEAMARLWRAGCPRIIGSHSTPSAWCYSSVGPTGRTQGIIGAVGGACQGLVPQVLPLRLI